MKTKSTLYTITLTALLTINFNTLMANNSVIERLVKKLEQTQPDTNRVKCLIGISSLLLYSYPDSALTYNKQAQLLADSLKYPWGQSMAYDILGIYYQNLADYKKAEEYYQKSLDIRIACNNDKLIAGSYNNFGVLNRKTGNYHISKEFFLKSLEIFEKLALKKQMAQAYNNLGLVNNNLGQYEESIAYHLKSLEIREDLDSKTNIASSLNNIGLVFFEINKYDKALEYLLKSLEIKEELGNKTLLGSAYQNIGAIKFEMNEYDEAMEYYTKSLRIFEEIKNYKSLADVLNSMAGMARKNMNMEEALSYNIKSIKIAKKADSKSLLCDTYFSASKTYHLLKRYKTALQYGIKAYEISINQDMMPKLSQITKHLYKLEMSAGNYKNACIMLEEHLDIKELLFTETSNQQIFELETKYQTEKKEKEIAQLSEENLLQRLKLERRSKTILGLSGAVLLVLLSTIFGFNFYRVIQKQKSAELEQSVLRLQMNPHFIFNAVSAIQKYVMDNKPLEASSYLSNFAKLMRSILNNSKKQMVNLETERQTLENYLKLQQVRLNGGLKYEISGVDELEAEELAIPPMLLQPFIENAIEHGILKKQDQQGKVDITFTENDNKLCVEVADNGVGRAAAAKQAIKNHKSHATEITQNRINSLRKDYKGAITFDIVDLKDENNNPVGTKVLFELPLMYL